ncbi:MAG: penicillin-binding protein 2 [Ignavibacteriaceae bacterium]|nr:penicillin-binding protein 2 [Ignavibacteriaceae bacterium]
MISFNYILRKNILLLLVIIVTGVYGFKLLQMQIVNNQRFEERSSSNSIKVVQQTPLRGVFYDRNLNILVKNIASYTVRITPKFYDTSRTDFLEAILSLEKGTIGKLLKKNKINSPYQAIKVKKDASVDEIGWIEENSDKLPGVDFIVELQRGYTGKAHGAHIFGYIREISQKQLEKDKDKYYVQGDFIGTAGLEKSYENLLRGEKGFNYILVDAMRREIGRYKDGKNDKLSLKGKDLVLSIDETAQSVAEEALRGRSGAVVAIEPSSGEILAMVSMPDYDLSQFSAVLSKDYLNQLYTDPLKPQFNRATMSLHPPGSTFKILASLAALEMGVIDETSTLPCTGGYTFGNRFFKCHGAHGATNVYSAIEGSCNTFYYQLIFKVGLDRLKDFATKFHLGVKTNVDLLEEAPGFIPNTAYYEKRYGKNWPRGILVSLGIGQGEISMTPLQLALMSAIVANDGKSYEPHLVKGYLDENKNYHPLKFTEINTGIQKKNLDIVKKGMYLVVNGAGTAGNIRRNDIHIAGKTGTAQNPHGLDHSIFIAFAPYEKPEIAVAVFVENAGFGSTYAAPIAQQVIIAYLQKKGYKIDSGFPMAQGVIGDTLSGGVD